MNSGKNTRYLDWLNQAKDDLLWGQDSARTGHFGGACFISQQAVPDGHPSEFFNQTMAKTALDIAEMIIAKVTAEIGN